jgi:hypothetical protein
MRLAAAAVVALALAVPARAAPILGVHGNADRFATLTGQDSRIRHTFVGIDQGASLQRIVWNPQGFGSPDVPGNRAQALYKAHPSKPYAFPEWGLWGFDDPKFVRDMATWVRSHKRVEFLAYFSGRPGSVRDLATKPQSRAAYRALIAPLG